MRICIIGGGVIGVSTAYILARTNVKVILIEANQAVAQETSYANGGQLSYSYVAPLADADVFCSLPKWLFSQDSPLEFSPNLSIQQWHWLLMFLSYCHPKKSIKTTEELLSLSLLSQKILANIETETKLQFFHQQKGKLILFKDKNKFEHSKKQIQLKNSYGIFPKALNKEACLHLEPALKYFAAGFYGGIYTPTDEVGNCHLFTQNLFQILQQLPNVEIHLNSKVQRFILKNNCIQKVILNNDEQEIIADQFVVAAGMQSVTLLANLNIKLAICALKGYSLSLPLKSIYEPPSISLTDYENKILYASIGPIMRIAAMVDIGSKDGIDPKRIHLFKSKVKQSFPRWSINTADIWSGNRPSTTDGKPIISKVNSWHNLWLNIGHGSLGFTLACGSAELLKQLIFSEKTSINPLPFTMRS